MNNQKINQINKEYCNGCGKIDSECQSGLNYHYDNEIEQEIALCDKCESSYSTI